MFELTDARKVIANEMPEAELQSLVEPFFRLDDFLVFHVRSPRGSEPGVPDLLMVKPPRVIFMELKRQKGRLDNRVRFTRGSRRVPPRRLPTQEEWFNALLECPGIEAYLVRPRDWLDGTVESIREGALHG